MVGVLAAKAALTRGGGQDEQRALHQVLTAPYGRVLLGVAAVGLFVYAVWRLLETWADPESKGKLRRAESLLSAFVYGSLGVEATRMVPGVRSGSGGS